MTFIEQACHRQAVELWRNRPNLHDWRLRIFSQILRYCEISGERPTTSASIVLFRGMAAVGADAYRKNAPALSELRHSLASEPQMLVRKLTEFYAKAEDELRLHREIVARMLPERGR
ncbi:hypothetical protein [Hyphomicrobium sp. MC8b]|jgi:hypothetical protein|uniref:hypothetical protein n=1 Tax=unclassified Hyphomicrobium TaxID=2619925 RepID=UPI00391A5CB3